MDILREWNIFLQENIHRIGCNNDVLRLIDEFKRENGNHEELNLLESVVRDIDHISYSELDNRIDNTARRICNGRED